MHRSLLEITDDLVALDRQLDALGGEISADDAGRAVEEAFDKLTGELRDKIDAYASLITEIEAREEVRRAEAKRIAERANADRNKAAFLRAMLVEMFERRGWAKTYETTHYRVTLATCGGPQPMAIDDYEVPEEYMRTKEVREVDRSLIRSELEQGKDLPFAKLLPKTKYVKIS